MDLVPVVLDVRVEPFVRPGLVVMEVPVEAVRPGAGDPEVMNVGGVVLLVSVRAGIDPVQLHMGAGPDVLLVPGAVLRRRDEVPVPGPVHVAWVLRILVGVPHDVRGVLVANPRHVRDKGGGSSSGVSPSASKSIPS